MFAVLPAVKIGVGLLAGIPVSKITNDIIKNNVTVLTKIDHVKVATGSVVIGLMAAESVRRFTDNLVDEVALTVKKVRNRNEDSDTPEENTE